jgi:lipoprotein-anchoring transpeptidase ErfK/SrfK
MTHTPTSAELTNVLAKPKETGLDARCLTGRALCISKRTNSLVWVIDGKPQIRMDVRFGSYETPTREGAFSIGWKSPNHVSTIYHTPMPYAMFFSGGQAVHYSADFAARGYAGASHGCVNVRNLSAIKSLYNQVAVGDKVIVYT